MKICGCKKRTDNNDDLARVCLGGANCKSFFFLLCAFLCVPHIFSLIYVTFGMIEHKLFH